MDVSCYCEGSTLFFLISETAQLRRSRKKNYRRVGLNYPMVSVCTEVSIDMGYLRQEPEILFGINEPPTS